MRKKVDSRIRTLVENCVKTGQRSLFVIVGDKGRDQVRALLAQCCLTWAFRATALGAVGVRAAQPCWARLEESCRPVPPPCVPACPAVPCCRGRSGTQPPPQCPHRRCLCAPLPPGGEPALHAVQDGGQGAALGAVVLQEGAVPQLTQEEAHEADQEDGAGACVWEWSGCWRGIECVRGRLPQRSRVAPRQPPAL